MGVQRPLPNPCNCRLPGRVCLPGAASENWRALMRSGGPLLCGPARRSHFYLLCAHPRSGKPKRCPWGQDIPPALTAPSVVHNPSEGRPCADVWRASSRELPRSAMMPIRPSGKDARGRPIPLFRCVAGNRTFSFNMLRWCIGEKRWINFPGSDNTALRIFNASLRQTITHTDSKVQARCPPWAPSRAAWNRQGHADKAGNRRHPFQHLFLLRVVYAVDK